MKVMSNFSGGVGSAVASLCALEKYGDVELWFSDTLWEDPTSYEFISDFENKFGVKVNRYCLGITPLELFEFKRMIPYNYRAPCTEVFKILPAIGFMRKNDITHQIIGYGKDEARRINRMKERDTHLTTKEFPLLELEEDAMFYAKKWDITLPVLYSKGFSHNNCGGRCIKQGVASWKLLRKEYPDRFEEVALWEEKMQKLLGCSRTILRNQKNKTVTPLPLRDSLTYK